MIGEFEPCVVFANHSQEHCLSFSPRFLKFECKFTNVTQFPIGLRFRHLEFVLHSNAAKYENIWRTRLKTFTRMVGEYVPWTTLTCP